MRKAARIFRALGASSRASSASSRSNQAKGLRMPSCCSMNPATRSFTWNNSARPPPSHQLQFGLDASDMCNVLIAASSALTSISCALRQSDIAGQHVRADVQSREMPATIDADTFAGDEVALDQEEYRFGDFRGAAPSPKRCSFDHRLVLVGSQARRLKNRAGRDRVDQNFRSQFQRETFGQAGNGGFG